MPSVLSVLIYSVVPVMAAGTGAILTAVRKPGPKLRSAFQHFAAGVVFSVVAVELLPDVVRKHRPLWVIVGFTLGIAAMLGLRWLTQSRLASDDASATRKFPSVLVIATAIDIILDGFLVGLGFALGAKQGKLLVAALGLELFSLGVATASTLMNAGQSRSRSVTLMVLLACGIPVGALAGSTLLRNISENLLETVLSFGLAALLFLVTEELLVEAHEVPETPAVTTCFFAGFLVFLILGIMV